MDSEHVFARNDVLPSWWGNLVGRVLSVMASGFTVLKQDATHIEVVASAGVGAAVVAIQGRWRYIEATITRAHPGGAAGTYDIFVTAKETNIVAVPALYTDATDYSFDLAITAHGATPPIVAGTVDVFRKVGEVQWDGAAITRVDQFVPAIRLHAHTHATGQSDPIAPADIGGATAADLTTEVTRAEAAEAAEVTRAEAAEAALNTAITNETTRAEAAETAETARAEAAEASQAPIGVQVPYTGSGDPPGGQWVIADGRLIDKTTFGTFFARTGHAYNLGVDPGSNKVRIPDKRGKKSMGAIDMGTGAGPNDNSHAQLARGARSGEVAHTTTIAEQPSHSHGQGSYGIYTYRDGGALAAVDGSDKPARMSGGSIEGGTLQSEFGGTSGATGGGGAHNNVDPSEADAWIVRIA